MTKRLIETLVSAAEDAGYEVRSYSGRAMYGKQCLGVDCDNPTRAVVRIIGSLVQEVDHAELLEIIEHLEDAKTDSMGRDAILYFPGIAYDEGSADDDAEVR